jgi:hypothetical protein
VTQRRASFPTRSTGDVTAALSTLARETARGLTSGGSR